MKKGSEEERDRRHTSHLASQLSAFNLGGGSNEAELKLISVLRGLSAAFSAKWLFTLSNVARPYLWGTGRLLPVHPAAGRPTVALVTAMSQLVPSQHLLLLFLYSPPHTHLHVCVDCAFSDATLFCPCVSPPLSSCRAEDSSYLCHFIWFLWQLWLLSLLMFPFH